MVGNNTRSVRHGHRGAWMLFAVVSAAATVLFSQWLNAQSVDVYRGTVHAATRGNVGMARGVVDSGGNAGDQVPGEMIVGLRVDANRKTRVQVKAALDLAEQALPGRTLRRFSLRSGERTVLVKLPQGLSVTKAVNDMLGLNDSRIAYAEPNHIVRVAETIPNDPEFSRLWGLHNTGQTGGTPGADISAPAAWDILTGSPDVIVAVIDSGVDYNHPDLADNIWINPGESGAGKETNGIDDDGNGYIDDVHGFDFVFDDGDPMDAYGHGTHVAGTIGAVGNNGLGVAGVNWTCKIMCLRFLNSGGSGNTYGAAESLNYAVMMGARITNNSWTSGSSSGQTMLDAITAARDAGGLFVASAGNFASDSDVVPHYPSGYDVDNILSVASTDKSDELSGFSNWGATSVDLAAPGSSIYSTYPPFVDLFYEDFQSVTLPTVGPQLIINGVNNYWSTIESDLVPGNIVLRGDSQSYPYQSNSDGAVLTPAFDTTGLDGLTLSFVYRFETEEDDDELIVDVWDGAAWSEILRQSSDCCPEYYYSLGVDLEQYRNDAMQVRFRWLTDADNNDYYGAEIDFIAIQYISTDYSGNAYRNMSGTSMSGPHVAGAAAMLLAQDADLSVEMLKVRLMDQVDTVPALDGLMVSNGRLNLAQSLFAEGPYIIAEPGRLAPTAPEGEDPPSQSFTLRSSGPDPITFSITDDADWLQTTPSSGTADTGSVGVEITVTYSTSSLPGGAYPAMITIDSPEADNSPRNVVVDLAVRREVYVDAGASGANDGSSWTDAYTDLQDALDASWAGEIWVAAGTYVPYQEVLGRASTFQLRNGVAIYGGFAGWETSLEQRDPATNTTILSGDLDGDDGPDLANNEENCHHVVLALGVDPTAILDGFVITGGNANSSYSTFSYGGGMFNGYGSSPTLTGCTFTANWANYGGGGLTNLYDSHPTLTNCSFTNNRTPGKPGGGMYNGGASSPTLINCTFDGNLAGSGAGMYTIGESSLTLVNCRFTRNVGTALGGAIHNNDGHLTLTNCTFEGNSALQAGGIYNVSSEGGFITLTNCIMWGSAPYEIHEYLGHSDITYSNIQGGWPGTGNMDVDPLFVDPDGPDDDPETWEDNDYHLSPDSPCVNAGDPGFVPNSGEKDLDDQPRIMGCRVDMGSDEFWVDCNDNAIADVDDISSGASQDCNQDCIPDDCEMADCDGDPACGDCQGNGTLDGCDIANLTSRDDDANGIPDECMAQVPLSPPAPHDARKNRYVSINPNNPLTSVAFQVKLVGMKRCSTLPSRGCSVDDDCEAAVPGSGTCAQHADTGTAGPWWVQDPQQEQLGCLPGPCGDEDWFARVDSTPRFHNWTLGTLHIGDCEIIPLATYEIRACFPPDATICSDPLTIGTIEQPFIAPGFRGHYGDVVGPVDAVTEEFVPPDGITNVVDVSAYILTKQNYGTATKPQTHPTWVDLHGLGDGNPPQYIINVSDLGQILKAIVGDAWTDDPGNMNPGQCP